MSECGPWSPSQAQVEDKHFCPNPVEPHWVDGWDGGMCKNV